MPPDFTRLDKSIYTYKYFLQQDICRLCWSKEAQVELHIKQKDCINDELTEKIHYCLNIELRCDNCPKKLCRPCCWKLEEFYDFKSFCLEADRRLQEIMNSSFSTPSKIKKADEIIKNSGDIAEDFSDDNNFLSGYGGESTLTQELNLNKENKLHMKNTNCQLINSASSKAIKHEKIDFEIGNTETTYLGGIKVKKHKLKKARIAQKEVINKKLKCKRKRSDTYCYVCRMEFVDKNELDSHNLSHGIEKGNLFKCFGCEKRFKTTKARWNHESIFCKGLREGYKCDLCNRFLPLRSTYEAHMIQHRNNLLIDLPDNLFQCTKCSMSFNTKLSLGEHLATHENRRKSYVCEVCGRVFSRQDYLHKHRLIHTGTKQHMCPHCNSKFAQRSSLTVHIRKHTGERPYSCDLCPQRCISSSNLRAHRQTHMGHKQFECAVCNKKFGYKISLEEHIASVHERSRSFSCEHCSAIYTRLRGLRRHLSAKHRKQEKADRASPKDGSTSQEITAGKDCDDIVCAKSTDEVSQVKKNEIKPIDAYEIKDTEEFVILNTQTEIILTKMF